MSFIHGNDALHGAQAPAGGGRPGGSARRHAEAGPADTVQLSRGRRGGSAQASRPEALGRAVLSRAAGELPAFRFAQKYDIKDIMCDPVKAAAFEREYLQQEAGYFAAARDPVSGLTYDGLALDMQTGRSVDARKWSAPSKECLDIAMCIKALGGDRNAALVVARDEPAKAAAAAAEILDRKVDSFMRFYEKYPGFGGFLPWFGSGGDVEPLGIGEAGGAREGKAAAPASLNNRYPGFGARPSLAMKDSLGAASEPLGFWKDKIPGLDNGEMLWTVMIAERSLRQGGFEKIADKYAKYIDVLLGNLTKIFYDDKQGKVRCDVVVHDPTSADSGYSPVGAETGHGSYITGEHGVHEGAMMVMFTTLFGDLPEGAAKKIWDGITMKRVEHPHGTTWQGYWGSPHESWSYLVMPMRDLPEYRSLFRIREEIRSQNAAERRYPGLAASVNEPGGNGYVDGSGIEGVGSQPVPHNDLFAVYGAFPMLLEFSDRDRKAGNYGLAWLHNMLKAPKMQGPLGGGESETNDGTRYSPLKTMDGTLTNVLALCGGLEKESADMLRHYGKYDQFVALMRDEYRESFADAPLREPSGFALPSMQVPTGNLPEYTSAK